MTFKKQFFLAFLTYIIVVSPLYAQGIDNQNQLPTAGEIDFADETELLIPDEETLEFPPETNLIERNLNTFSFWDFIRMVLILLFVIACIYGLFFIIRKAGTQKFPEDDLINIISSRSITPGKTIHIIEIGNHMMVVGVADNSISTLFEITDKETIDDIMLKKGEEKKPTANSFQQYLFNIFFSKRGDKKNKSLNEGMNFDYFKKQRDRIGKM